MSEQNFDRRPENRRIKNERRMRNYYADPTANTAIANVDRELRRERKRREEEWRREEARQNGPGYGGGNRGGRPPEGKDGAGGKPPVSPG